MKKVLKIVAFSFGAIVLSLLIIPLLIPRQKYIDWAIKAIEDRLPVQLSLEDAELHLLPIPHMTLYQVQLKLQQADETYADVLSAMEIEVTSSVDFDIRKLGSLQNLETIVFREATLLYPPGNKNAKPTDIAELVIDNIELKSDSFKGDLNLNGRYGQLTLIGDMLLDLRRERHRDIVQGQATLRSKRLTVLYADDIMIRNQAISLQTDFYHSPQKSTLRKSSLQIGPQSVSLTADRDATGVNVDFKAASVELNFLKSIIPALKVMPVMGRTAAEGQLSIPAIKTEPVRVTGKINSESLQLGTYGFEEVSSDVTYEKRKLQFYNVKARIFDGSIMGDINFDFVKPRTRYNANLTANAIAVEQIGDVGESLSGRAHLTLKAQGQGFGKADLEQHLEGAGDLEIKDLKLKKMKFFRPLMSLQQWTGLSLVTGLINKAAFDKAKNLDEEAKNLIAYFTMGSGEIKFTQIRVHFPEAQVQLKGKIDFDENLDFDGTLNMSGGLASSLFAAPKAQQNAASEQGLTSIPLKVKGTLQSPDIGINEHFLSGKLEGIAALPVRVLTNALTLPLRLLTPRSHRQPTQDVETEGSQEDDEAETNEEPTKKRSLGPAPGGGRRR